MPGREHAGSTKGRKSACRSQAFSKRKVLVLGIFEDMWTRRGVWSETSRVCEVMEELGKRMLISELKKIRSRRSMVGSSRPFDQVKRRSRRGSSVSARASMELLNRKHKAWFILLLFLSASP